ncbi:MAG: hypothetical protein CMD04_02855 [Flavobacteriales bacterium]|nr:hypothetical protein [Flavobacteriales bacterium]
MELNQIQSNEKIKTLFLSAKKSKRIPHAQLIFGDEDTPILPLAWAYAKILLCKNNDEDACGTCASCLQVKKMIHPDLHWVFPILSNNKNKNISSFYMNEFREALIKNPFLKENEWYNIIGSENKQGFIGVSEVLDLTKKISLKPYYNGFKIVIFWLADKMNESTSNKLLKFLEEPNRDTVFLITTHKKENLLPTINSRLQSIKVEHNKKSHEVFSTTNDENLNYFKTWARSCYKLDFLEISDWVEKISGLGRENQKSFLKYSLQMIRSCILLQQNSSHIDTTSNEEQEFIKNFSPFINNNSVKIISYIEAAFSDIIRNGNSKILLTDLSLKFSKQLRIKKIN